MAQILQRLREEGEEVSNGSSRLGSLGQYNAFRPNGAGLRSSQLQPLVKVGGYCHNFTMGNVVRKSDDKIGLLDFVNRLNSEVLKMIENEKHKPEKFEEALALASYDQAMTMAEVPRRDPLCATRVLGGSSSSGAILYSKFSGVLQYNRLSWGANHSQLINLRDVLH
ncbi:hypothetical protein Ancab_036363 [Ancistrocladus abbreviatus]